MTSVNEKKDKEEGVVISNETALETEVTIGQNKGIEVPNGEENINEGDVEAELDRMAERNARITTVERPIVDGNTVVLDFEGFDNGVPFEGGKAEKHTLKIGSNQFVPGFEEALIGASAGEEKDIDVTFPENYTPELAGKPVVFKCKIHEVKETAIPTKDDEFAKYVSEFDTLEALKADLQGRFLKNREDAIAKEFENAAVMAAANNMTSDIPD